jgi:LacI family transcriptional regulator, gluconate utilization system Gnt-I transcriptional repressor
MAKNNPTKNMGNINNLSKSQIQRRITISDVARLAKVGTMTVSRALNHPKMVSDALRQRILEAVETLGYIPNRVAGDLASGSGNAICVIVPTLNHPVYVPFLEGLYGILPAAGYQILLGTSEYLLEGEEHLVGTFLGWQPIGMILAGVDHSPRTRAMLAQANVPVVEIMDLTAQPIDINVGFSHEAVGQAVGQFLLERGYQQIAYVGNRLERDTRGMRRLNGFSAALEGAKDTTMVVLNRDLSSSIQAGGVLLGELLEQYPQTEVAFFVNDDLAAGALFECQRRGIRVPQDFAIVGFNDQEIAAQVNPSLTSVSTQRLQMGQRAAELLLARLRGEPLLANPIDTGFQIVERQSTCQQRSRDKKPNPRTPEHERA